MLDRRDVRALVEACARSGFTGRRDRALIVVLYRGGLRVCEAIALPPDAFDYKTSSITTVADGRPSRRVELDLDATYAVQRWAELRNHVLGFDARSMFCTREGDPLNPACVRQGLGRLARKACIRHPVCPRALRDAHAAELLAAGVTLRDIQQRLGFAHLKSTLRYLGSIH